MSKQKRRWRGKLGGDHSTVIEAAWRFLPNIIAEPCITRISPGVIKNTGPSGRTSVKIIDDVGCIMLSVRGGTSHQEIRVFTSDFQGAKLAIARAARDAQFRISFGRRV